MPKNNIIDCQRVEVNSIEPLSLAEAKSHLIVTFTDDDDYITSLITQCRKAIESYCNISMVVKTITLIADWYNEWELPYGPVTSLISVFARTAPTGSGPVIYDTDPGNWTIDGSQFLTFAPNNPGYWDWGLPIPRSYTRNCEYPQWCRYKIVYTAGPFLENDLLLAVLNEMAFRYENRGEAMEIRPTPSAEQGLCPAAQRLAEPYRRLAWL